MASIEQEKKDAKLLYQNASDRIRSVFRDLARMVAEIETQNARPTHKQEAVLERFATEMSRAMTISDVYGRLRTMEELGQKEGKVAAQRAGISSLHQLRACCHPRIFANEEPTNPGLVEWLDLPFDEAAQYIAEREPALATGWREAAEVYARHGFALARNTSIKLAEELQRRFTAAIEEGRNPLDEAKDARWLAKEFDRSYLNIVASTNFAGAYIAGRERQMRQEGVAKHVVAHRFVSALLPTTRKNHRACHNFLADPDDELWHYLSPALGYQCFCRKRPVFKAEIKTVGIEINPATGKMYPAKRPAGGEPDSEIWGRRSDITYYGKV